MTDPVIPAVAEEHHTLNLADIGHRYLRALQRLFDLASYLAEGSRLVSERGYDEMAKSVRFMPSQKEHRAFDAAREEADRYLLKNLLGDLLTLVVPFLEDLRVFCGLAAWQTTERDPKALERLVIAERADFLKLDLVSKFGHLRDVCGLTSPLTPSVLALTNVGVCLAARGGVVSEKDVTSGNELTVTLIALDLLPSDAAKIAEGAAVVTPRLGELRKTFAIGETVRFEKTEYLNIIATVSLFTTTLLTATQKKLQAEAAI
jgi:hypothetical protein